MKRPVVWLAVFLFLDALLIYGRSLRYDFVYDDHWRIETNPAIRRLSNIPHFFTATETQASRTELHYDSYRPLGTVSFALDYAMWKDAPAGYRLENIFLHGLNGLLVSLLALQFLNLSFPAALLAGLIFLNHPVQVESVVWIVERVNLLGTMFMLSGLLSWLHFRKSQHKPAAALTYACLAGGLLLRETMVCFPVFLYLADRTEAGWNKNSSTGPLPYRHYAAMSVAVLAYLVLRAAVIGQVKIAPFWGGSFALNLANVLKIWPLYLKSLLWPFSLRMTYGDLETATGLFDPGALKGMGLLAALLAAAVVLVRRAPRFSFCVLSFLLFWLPGSNLIPMMILFAERLLYPMMVFFSWTLGLLVDRFPYKKAGLVVGAGLVLICTRLTIRQIPVWQNDYTLWVNATSKAPKSWFAWACRGQAELERAGRPGLWNLPGAEMEWLERAGFSYHNALGQHVPVDTAGTLFLNLAWIRLRQGRSQEADSLAERAMVLNPQLGPAWERMLNSVESPPRIP